MAHSMIVTEMKNKLLSEIQADENIVSALNIHEDEDPEDLIYHRLFPCWFTIETQEVKRTYIFVEVAIEAIRDRRDTGNNNIYYDEPTIVIRVVSHEDDMRMDESGISAVRTDYIAQLLDEKFNGKYVAGIGELQRLSNIPYSLNDTYRYRELVFKALDFNKEMCDVD